MIDRLTTPAQLDGPVVVGLALIAVAVLVMVVAIYQAVVRYAADEAAREFTVHADEALDQANDVPGKNIAGYGRLGRSALR